MLKAASSNGVEAAISVIRMETSMVVVMETHRHSGASRSEEPGTQKRGSILKRRRKLPC